jgi:hypothetical protein
MPTFDTRIARLAAAQFTQRQARARAAVRSGQMDPRTATQHLRPWLAIACHCGADLPDLTDGIAELRTRQVVWGEPGEVTEGEARARLADDICPRAVWAPVLTKARDAAYTGPLTTAEQNANAVALREIASHLQFDPSGRHDIPFLDIAAARAAQDRRAAA